MASQTITLKTQVVNAFAPSPSTKWGSTFNWTLAGVGPGNGTWGLKSAACLASQPIIFAFFKNALGNSSMSIGLSLPAGNITATRNKLIGFGAALTLVYSNSDKELTDGGGYYYVYPLPTSNIADRLIPTYASQSVASTTYTSQLVSQTTWS